MPLSSEYKHSNGGETIIDAATFPLRGVYTRYLRFCCVLIYLLITEAEVSQSAELSFAEGEAPLFSDSVAP